ncbi:hypothetical protein M0R19_05530 [Candidatus Pacearchaeota archaeon]|nr:hypothetical protein [Candidatus Pacearchaeota archaeon]
MILYCGTCMSVMIPVENIINWKTGRPIEKIDIKEKGQAYQCADCGIFVIVSKEEKIPWKDIAWGK